MPLFIQVVSGEVDALATLLVGRGVLDGAASADAATHFSIMLGDRFGNLVTEHSELRPPAVEIVGTAEGAVEALTAVQIDKFTKRVNEPGTGVVSYLVSYFRPMPGTYEIMVSVAGAVVGSGKAVSLSATPAQPPRVLRCQMDNSLAAITLVFDRPTDEASQATPFPCSRVVITKYLGLNPECAWERSSAHEPPEYASHTWAVLVLYLGFGANVQTQTHLATASRVQLIPGTIFSQDRNSFSATGFYAVLPPTVTLPVLASLSLPELSGPCAAFLVDASGSTGDGGRALHYRFGVFSPDGGDTSTIRSLLEGVDPSFTRSAVLIPPDLVVVGFTYEFTVQVSNWLGEKDSLTQSLQATALMVPIVHVDGAPFQNPPLTAALPNRQRCTGQLFMRR